MVDVTLSLIGANGDEIVFSDEGDFVLTSGLAGLGIPATQVRIDDSASDGGVWRFSKRGVRELDLPVVVLGADRATVEANLRRLTLLLSDRVGGVVLQAAYSSGEVWHLTQGHYVAGASGVRGDDGGLAWERWVLSLQFANPFWISQASESFAVGAPASSGSFLPNLAELVVSSAQAVGSVTVENPGDVDAFPVWSLRGPADSVTISNGSESFVYDAPILASSTVVVDTAAGTVTDQVGANKYGSLSASPSLFALPAGVSQVSVTATNASAGAWTDVETLATNLVTNPSMEASSGTVTVRTNLVTNPSMEAVSTGAVVMRRNLVTNPSVEVDLAGWGVTGLTHTRVTTEFYVGTASIRAAATAIDQYSYTPAATVTPSQAYTASIWLKGEAGKSFHISLFEYNSGGTGGGQTNGAITTATGSWQRLSVTRTLSSTAATARIVIFNKTAGAHTFYVDAAMIEAGSTVGDFFDGSTTDALGWDYAWSGTANASISTAASAATTVRTNLVTNPSAENSSTVGFTSNDGSYTVAQSSEQKMFGTYSMKLTATSASRFIPATFVSGANTIPATAGTTYTLSLYVYSSITQNMTARFNWLNGSTILSNTEGNFVSVPANTWTRVSVTGVAPASTTQMIPMWVNQTAAVTGTVLYVDGLFLEAGSTLGDYFDGSFTPAGDFSYGWSGTANASTSIQRGATVASWLSDASTICAVRSQKYVGSQSVNVAPSVNNGGLRYPATTTVGTVYTWSAWVFTTVAKNMRVFGAGTGSSTTLVPANTWTRLSVTYTASATSTEHYVSGTDSTQPFFVDAAMLEASPIVQDYFDGSVVSADADLTNSWSGTAHASTSLMRGVGVTSYDAVGPAAPIQSSNWASTGTKSVRLIPTTGATNNRARFIVATTVGVTYTAKAKVRLTAPLASPLATQSRTIRVTNIAGTQLAISAQAPNTAGVYELSVTFTAVETTTNIELWNGATVGNGDVWWDDLIVVAGSYTGDYFDGNSTTLRENGYAWTGTANASTSTWKRREIQGATLISCNYQPRKEIVH